MKLKYVGKGNYLAGVPARDLTAEEVKRYGEQKLLQSKLYVKAAKPQKEKQNDSLWY